MITRIVHLLTSSDISSAFFSALDLFSGDDVVHTEFHDMSSTAVNGSAGAFVALGTGAAMPVDIKSIRVSTSTGTPLVFRVGADATAANAASNRFVLNRGEDNVSLNIKLTAGQKLWIRSLVAAGGNSGLITCNFIG